MSTNTQKGEEEDDYIRPPDKVKRERLTDFDMVKNDEYKEDDYLQQCIMQSLIEQQSIQNANEMYEKYILQEEQRIQEANDLFEKSILEKYQQEIFERKQKFSPFLINLIKLKKYDDDFEKVFEILSPMIDCYCQELSIVPLDSKIHEFILKKIKTMRYYEIVLPLLQ